VSGLGYDVVHVPTDGQIARWYQRSEPGLSEDGSTYFYWCLLRGMRGEQFPAPRGKLTAMDTTLIRDKARGFLPDIERVRGGEIPLEEVCPFEPVQRELVAPDELGF
jgi:hypothetical protein